MEFMTGTQVPTLQSLVNCLMFVCLSWKSHPSSVSLKTRCMLLTAGPAHKCEHLQITESSITCLHLEHAKFAASSAELIYILNVRRTEITGELSNGECKYKSVRSDGVVSLLKKPTLIPRYCRSSIDPPFSATKPQDAPSHQVATTVNRRHSKL